MIIIMMAAGRAGYGLASPCPQREVAEPLRTWTSEAADARVLPPQPSWAGYGEDVGKKATEEKAA